MKTKQRFLTTLLMATVMMTMCPMKMWALPEPTPINVGTTQNITNIYSMEGDYAGLGSFTLTAGGTFTATFGEEVVGIVIAKGDMSGLSERVALEYGHEYSGHLDAGSYILYAYVNNYLSSISVTTSFVADSSGSGEGEGGDSGPSILPSGSALAMGENHVTLAESEYATYTFTPAETGYYLIYSGAESGDFDLYIDGFTLEGGSDIERQEDDVNGNFRCVAKLTAANTYNITINNDYSAAVEDCKVYVEKAPTFIYTATADMGNFFNYEYQNKVLCEEYTDSETPVTVALLDKVTSIEGNKFFGAQEFTSITLPSSVTSIGESAFQACFGLTSITLPSGVTSIGNSAFLDCPNLANVAFNSVPLVGDNVFTGCAENIEYTLTLTDNSYVYTGAGNNFPTTVASATYTRTMPTDEEGKPRSWGTAVLPFTIVTADQKGVKPYCFSGGSSLGNEDATLTVEVMESVDAGHPFLFYNTAGNASVTFANVAQEGQTINISTTIVEDTYAFSDENCSTINIYMYGTYGEEQTSSEDANIYFIARDKFWWAEESITISSFRAWFEILITEIDGEPEGGDDPVDAPAKSFNIIIDGEADGIKTVNSEQLTVNNGKFIENGKVVVVKNGKKFNVNGQRVR